MTALSAQQQTLGIFAGVGVILFVASVIGFALKTIVARGEPHRVIDNLNARIRAWWVMVLVIACAFSGGQSGVTLLFFLISFVALREFLSAGLTRDRNDAANAASFFLVLPLQYVLVYDGRFELFAIFIPVYVCLLLPIVYVLSADTRRLTERMTTAQWGLMLCVYGISYVPALLTLEIPGFEGEGRNLLLIAFLVLVVQSSDVLQYVWGMLFGRHKVAPKMSPSKTWEGLIGGVASATALGTALFWITPFNPWQAALMALATNTMGFLGGLVMSAIKRDRGVKDWGNLIDGHGGMLDRLDSVVFAAPVFFHLTRFYWS